MGATRGSTRVGQQAAERGKPLVGVSREGTGGAGHALLVLAGLGSFKGSVAGRLPLAIWYLSGPGVSRAGD